MSLLRCDSNGRASSRKNFLILQNQTLLSLHNSRLSSSLPSLPTEMGVVLLSVVILVSSGLMLKLTATASATVSAKRRSEIACAEKETLLATILLPH
jgi:hypothetical protein